MLTVKINYKDGTSNLVDCWSLDEICLDGVVSIRVIRNERKVA